MVVFTAGLLAALAATASAQGYYGVPEPSVSLSTPAAGYPMASPSTPPPAKDCQKIRSDCLSKPDANQSYCASLYYACTGGTPGVNTPTPSATPSTPAGGYPVASPSTPPAKDCEKVRSDCQSKPDAKQSYCTSLYYACTGGTPGLNTPTPSQTTVSYSVYTTVCPATAVITSGSTTHTSLYTTTSTVTTCNEGPSNYPVATPSACEIKYNSCRNGEDGGDRDLSKCNADFAACQASSAPAPTYPAGTPTGAPPATTPLSACEIKYNSCRNGEDGGDRNLSKCNADYAACQAVQSGISYPAGNPTGAPPASTPISDCERKYNSCRNGEDGGDRNLSKCNADFAACQSSPTPGLSYPSAAPPPPAQTYPPAPPPAQTYPPAVQSGTPPKGNTTVPFAGAASTVQAGFAGLSGLVALVFLL